MKSVCSVKFKSLFLILGLGMFLSTAIQAQGLNQYTFGKSFHQYSTINFGNANLTNKFGDYKLDTTDAEYGSGFPSVFNQSTPLVWDMTQDSAETSFDYFSLWNPQSTSITNYFSKDFLMVKEPEVECPGPCRSDYYNCGWGPITNEKFQATLKACNVKDYESYNQPVFYSSTADKITLRCAIDGVTAPVETSLDSLSDLLKYDCENMKKLGDGPYCHCVLNKSGQKENDYYTPLTSSDVTAIEQMMQLDYYQKQIRALQNSFSRVSNVLSAAILKSPKLKEAIEKDPRAKSCLPGSYNQVEAFLTAEDSDGKSTCGDGIKAMNRVAQINRAEELCSGEDKSKCPKEFLDIDGNLDFDAVLRHTTEFQETAHSATSAIRGAASRVSFFGGVEERAIDDLEEYAGEDIAQRVRATGQNVLQLRGKCTGKSEQRSAEENALCSDASASLPERPYSYATDIAMLMKDYRAGKYKSADEFIKSMGPKGQENLSQVFKDVGESFQIIKLGVLDNPVDGESSPEAMLIKLLDDVLTKADTVSGTEGDVSFANKVKNSLGTIEGDLVNSAKQSCFNFVEKTRNMCRELDEGLNKKLSIGDYKKFKPEDALKFANSAKMGSLSESTPVGLNRKLNQLRCSRIVADKDIAKKAFSTKSEAVADTGAQGGVMDALRRDLEPSSSEEVPSVDDSSPFTASPERVASAARSSENAGLNEMARDLQAVAAARGTSSEAAKLEGLAQFDDGATSMQAISNMANDTLGKTEAVGKSSGSTAAASNFSKTISNYNEKQLSAEADKVNKEKAATDSRLDEITARLADLMESRKQNSSALEEKGKNLSDEEKESDSSYKQLEMQKIALQKEIESLSDEKKSKLVAKEKFQQQLAEIESAKAAKGVAGKVANNAGLGAGKVGKDSKKSTGAAKGGPSGGRRSSGFVSSAGGAGGGGGGPTTDSSAAGFEASPYVITLGQDELSAAKQTYQVVESLNKWVPGGKPPALRIGNILYEVEVKDGKIVYENGKPKMLRSLNLASTVPGSGLIDPKTVVELESKKKGRSPASMRERFSVDILNSTMDKSSKSAK